MFPNVNCPKCSRILPADGEVEVSGSILPVYHCHNRVIRSKFMGMIMELPLTFIIGPDGHPADPGDPDSRINLTPYE